MLTRFAKIMTVGIAFGSIALMGAAITISNAGPNWQEQAEQLPDYIFVQDAATKLWSVKHRLGENLKSGVPHPAAVAAAYADAAARNREATAVLEPQIEPLEKQIEEIKAFRAVDEAGLASRMKQLKDEFDQVSEQVQAVAEEADSNADAALKIRTEAAARRRDVQRLTVQLQGIETDHFHLREQRHRLLDLLYQMDGQLIRMRDRNVQLKATGVPYDEEDPAVPDPSASTDAAAGSAG